MKDEYYVTTFCNFVHRLRDGRPVGPPEGPNGKRTRHDCPQLSPTKLRLERDFGANAVESSMTEFFPGETEALAEDDEDALNSLYWQHAPIPKCWLCDGRGYIEAPDEFSSAHTERLNCPVCEGNPLMAGALLPALPLTGYAYLVQWFDRAAGNNVLIARTLAQMRKMVLAVSVKHPYAELISGDFVMFVRPPDEYQVLYANVQKQRTEFSFWKWIELRLQVLRERGQALPEPLGLCPQYKKKRMAKAGEPDPDHEHCANCTYGVTLRGADPAEWYAKRQNAYYAGIARKVIPIGLTMAHPLRREARAAVSLSPRRLYYISPDEKTNRPRSRLHPAPTDNAERAKLFGFGNQPTLWFERLGDYPDMEASKKILTQAAKAMLAECAARSDAASATRREIDELSTQAFLDMVKLDSEY